MDSDLFDWMAAAVEQGSSTSALQGLAERLKSEQRYHELFDARLMAARTSLGLSPGDRRSVDELTEDHRTAIDAASLSACREVGELLAAAGRFREAWLYLKPTNERTVLATALAEAAGDEISDDRRDELIEVALHEGVAPVVGLQLVLEHYGTCNAITMLQGTLPHLAQTAQETVTAALVHHLHHELTENVRGHIERERGQQPSEATLAELVAAHEWITEDDCYHIDTSHLSSTVRFARLLTEPAAVQLAWELCEYGRRLSEMYQFPGESPFQETYLAHGLFFAATLGREAEHAVEFFRERLNDSETAAESTAPIETYLILLDRLDRQQEALEAYAEFVPVGVQLSPYAPDLLQLARQGNQLSRYLEICRERGDLLAYAAAIAVP